MSENNYGSAVLSDGKRAAARQKIESYYYQLIEGCGRTPCSNEYCASSGPKFLFPEITCNSAAAKAIELFKNKGPLCDVQRPKILRAEQGDEASNACSHNTAGSMTMCAPERLDGNQPSTSARSMSSTDAGAVTPRRSISDSVESARNVLSSLATTSKSLVSSLSDQLSSKLYTRPPMMTEEMIEEIMEVCVATGDYSQLIRTVGSVFNNTESLLHSFRLLGAAKEEQHAKEQDKDKDTDETQHEDTAAAAANAPAIVEPYNDECSLDFDALHRTFTILFSMSNLPFQSALINALTSLTREIEMELKYKNPLERDPAYLNIFLIIIEIPVLFTGDFLDTVAPLLCRSIAQLPVKGQVQLCRCWARRNDAESWLRDKLNGLQQLITLKSLTTEWSSHYTPNDDEGLTSTVKVLKLIYLTSILLGDNDPPEVLAAEKETIRVMQENSSDQFGAMGRSLGKEPVHQQPTDPLQQALGVNPINCRRPLIPWQDFVNEPLCDILEVDHDFHYYKTDGKFSFLSYPFILTTAVKNSGLYFDNKLRMINERRQSIFDSLIRGLSNPPFLKLRVRRANLIEDALVNLEVTAIDNPQDLKKQLYVEFDGEQGIDEGGVSKEFFQLIVEKLFDPNYGMFIQYEESRRVWFNALSFENHREFTLIGIILGIAIYNNCILDVHFPPVVYSKLVGKKGTLADLVDLRPTLARSLQSLLDYEGDVEEDFMCSFIVSEKDMFGSLATHELKPGGKEMAVTNGNRQEFVDLYVDFLLNKQISQQFTAFYRGFHMVTDESPMPLLFRPDEIELLVCGIKEYNFNELEEATQYDGGFTEHSQTVLNFWEIVHAMSDQQKRDLLRFTTGSDRVPVGGLKKLRLIIAKNGPDSDRLPTAHTCFNVLLLPDYSTKDKLQERLYKAINYAQGFGML